MNQRLIATLVVLTLAGNQLRAAVPDFKTEVMPVLTKAGCNTGACHGAAIGRGGFRLSLLGYDAAADYDRLLHELEGRRVNLARPEKSLLLRKPGGMIAHEGGIRLGAKGDGFRLVKEWIAGGAPLQGGRSLKKLEVSPAAKTLNNLDQKFAVQVFAHFSDGTRKEVTQWSVFTPTDKSAVRCSKWGEVRVLRRGQSAVMVRFLGEVGCVRVTVPLADEPVKAKRPEANFIDNHVNQTLDDLHLPHSGAADEAMQVRRLYLDLIGTLPTPQEVKAYVSNAGTGKYARLVGRLLQRPEFVDHWSYKYGDLFRIESKRLQPQGAAAFHNWVRDQVARNTPVDRMARELILALGDAYESGPVNFHRIPNNPQTEAEFVSQVFLGVRLQCANCHNHPLDRWTQDDYHGLSAIFARLARGRVVQAKLSGDVIHPKTGKNAVPRLPGTAFLEVNGKNRQQFARWLTDPKNPYFARAFVNRLWRELMGRGLVEPVDDHRATNPATHPELLQALAKDFATHGFDMRHAIKAIVTSASYRRSSLSMAGNKTDDRFYSKALVRPLPPPVLVDAVAKVTGIHEPLGKLPAGTKAISLGDARVKSEPLDLLGRCDRMEGCTTASSTGLPSTLHAIHGDWLNKKIGHPKGRLHQMIQQKKSNRDIVATFYQLALCRKPSAKESAYWHSKLGGKGGAKRTQVLEDFVWALLNTVEFSCNH